MLFEDTLFKKDAAPVTIKVPELSLRTVEVPPAVVEAAKTVRQKKKDAITRILNYEHTPIITAAAVGFLTGVIVGFLISPVKNGIKVLSDNDLHNEEFVEDDSDDYDDLDELEEV